MANRNYNEYLRTLAKYPVTLWAKVTFGSSGAPTLVTGTLFDSQGIKSISRTSAGLYVITYGTGTVVDTYFSPLFFGVTYVNATAPAAPLWYVTATTSSTVTIQFTNTSGTATDPGSGEEVFLKFDIKNSSAA